MKEQQSSAIALRVGAARQNITCTLAGVGMLGYGKAGNVVAGVLSPQYARAFVVSAPEGTVAYVCADICFVTDALKVAVMAQLAVALPEVFDYDNVMLAAQHTHSGAGGYGQHFFTICLSRVLCRRCLRNMLRA